eukprot:5793178-Amphidinium_carterae.1
MAMSMQWLLHLHAVTFSTQRLAHSQCTTVVSGDRPWGHCCPRKPDFQGSAPQACHDDVHSTRLSSDM